MWRALTQLPSLVTELIALHRESNSLTRELIALLSGRSAVTPMTPARLHPLVARTLAQGNAPAAGTLEQAQTQGFLPCVHQQPIGVRAQHHARPGWLVV